MEHGPAAKRNGAPPIGVAVVGHGYWGPKVVRVLSWLDDFELRSVVDRDPERLNDVVSRDRSVATTTDFCEVVSDPGIEAVVLCTPLHTHFELAKSALNAGKHVLVEKPLTQSVATAEELVRLAEDRGLVLQVDHTFLYSGAVQRIRSIVENGDLGDLLYFDSVRINLGLFQQDVNVLWDLAPHDLSIMNFLIDRQPRWLSAIGSSRYGDTEHLAYVTLMYDDDLIAHLHLSWLAPVKLRRTLIGGSKRMIVYDDLDPSEPVRIYEKGVTLRGDSEKRERALVDYRIGDMFAPHIDRKEPLQAVCEQFFRSIREGERPLSDGRDGLRVVRLLEAAQLSLSTCGERIPLSGSPDVD